MNSTSTLRLLADLSERAHSALLGGQMEWSVTIAGAAVGTLFDRDSRPDSQRARLQQWGALMGQDLDITETQEGDTTHLEARLQYDDVPVTLRAVCPPYRPRLCGHVSDEGLSCQMRPGHTSWVTSYAMHLHRAEDGTTTRWEYNSADLNR